MANIYAFENFSNEYDQWFDDNRLLYQLELEAVKDFIPENSYGLDIGVGSGKFSLPFGISIGVDPSFEMSLKSKKNGIDVYLAVAEALPFKNEVFDFAVMVTSICFVDDVQKSFNEANRVLKMDGEIIIGFVDKDSELGRRYNAKKNESRFYSEARFYSTADVVNYLEKSGFGGFEFNQTIFSDGDYSKQKFRKGYGDGSFVVIKAFKRVMTDSL